MTEKIQKVLAHAGIASRRQIESWIAEGRISINGKPATIGARIALHDQIKVDGQEIKLQKSRQQKTRVLLYHKPEGELCTRHDPENRPTIFERLPLIRNSRWITVGRLDFNTAGLLLLTNDGDLANELMHPKSIIEREYAVRIRGNITPEIIDRLKKGIFLHDGLAAFDEIIDVGGSGSNHWYHVIVKEGRNRLVRRLWEKAGLTVSRLIRVRFGPLALPPNLKRGKSKELTQDELEALRYWLTHRES